MEELYEVYGQLVYRFLLSACRDEALAEDLTQDTFLQAFQSLERFRGECRISAWLCQIARHLYWQHLEKQGGRVPEAMDETIPAPCDTEAQALHRVELAEVLEPASFWALFCHTASVRMPTCIPGALSRMVSATVSSAIRERERM